MVSVLCSSSGGFSLSASETPSTLAPQRLRDTCDGSPSAERSERRGGGGRRRKGKKRKESHSRSSVLTCFSRR